MELNRMDADGALPKGKAEEIPLPEQQSSNFIVKRSQPIDILKKRSRTKQSADPPPQLMAKRRSPTNRLLHEALARDIARERQRLTEIRRKQQVEEEEEERKRQRMETLDDAMHIWLEEESNTRLRYNSPDEWEKDVHHKNKQSAPIDILRPSHAKQYGMYCLPTPSRSNDDLLLGGCIGEEYIRNHFIELELEKTRLDSTNCSDSGDDANEEASNVELGGWKRSIYSSQDSGINSGNNSDDAGS